MAHVAILTLKDTAKWLSHLRSLPRMCKNSGCSVSLPILGIAAFDYKHSSGCVAVSYSVNLPFPNV